MSNQPALRCGRCLFRTSNFTQMRDHVGDLGPHPDEVDITCEICQATFRSTRDMAHHFPVRLENLYDGNFLLPCPLRPSTPSTITVSSDYVPGQDTPYSPGSHTHSSFITQQQLSNASPSPLPISTSTENFRRNLRSFTTNSAPRDDSQTSSESLHTYSASSSRPHSRSPAPSSHSPLSLQAHAYGHHMLILQAHRDEARAHVQLLANHLIWLPESCSNCLNPPSGRCCAPSLGT